MKNLLNYDFHRLIKGKIAWIMLAIMVGINLLYLFVMCMAYLVLNQVIDPGYLTACNLTFGYFSNEALITILGIFIALFMLEEKSQDVYKTIIGRGYSRLHFFFSKFIMIVSYSAVALLISWLTMFLFYLIAFGKVGEFTWEYFSVLSVQYINLLAFVCLLTMFVNLTSKYSSGILIAMLGPLGIQLLLSVLDSSLASTLNGNFMFSWLYSGTLISLIKEVVSSPGAYSQTIVTVTWVLAWVMPVVYVGLSVYFGYYTSKHKE